MVRCILICTKQRHSVLIYYNYLPIQVAPRTFVEWYNTNPEENEPVKINIDIFEIAVIN